MRLGWLIALVCAACASQPDAPVPASRFNDGSPMVCEQGCPDGAFCSTRGLCASAGPVACPLPCPAGLQCGPFVPGCAQASCTVDPGFPADVQKVIRLEIASGDEGCDLDGDGAIDNALGGVARLVPGLETSLRESVETARTVVLLRPEGESLSFWFGALQAASLRCNAATSEAFCHYTASPWSFDTTGASSACDAWFSVRGLSMRDDGMSAGSTLPAESLIPFDATTMLLRLSRPRVSAAIEEGVNGRRMTHGVACAAMVPAQLRLALTALPSEVIDDVGGLDQARWFFDTLVHPDLDLDADGEPEHVSISLSFETTPALVTGLSAP